ncbi:MAG: hypothetical protein KF689_12515 [Gemmatimonadaceae bacterium]|nr:hypothetical protein [Gemmatimonadaceae bacterium]MCW5827195.1 hypothetical protein [Gemmatimonadaceae bacterium]
MLGKLLRYLWPASLICGLILPARTATAQSGLSQERIDELMRGSYRPASSPEQMQDCHFRALTRGIELDADQEARIRAVIALFRRAPNPAAGSREWTLRFAERDSSALSVLTQRADSIRYRRNAQSERAWFSAGNCNGR